MIVDEGASQELDSGAQYSNNDAPPPSYSRAPGPGSPRSSTEKAPIINFPTPNSFPVENLASSSSGNRSSYYALSSPSSWLAAADLNPHAPFSRVPAEHLLYDSFPPMFLVAIGKTLAKGFLPVPPPSTTRPHPFASHDVTEDDWLRFLKELETSANLTEKDIRRSHLPIIFSIPIVSPIAKMGVQQYMKGQKRNKVVKVIDTWNHHFFELRKLRVILMRGRMKLSGGAQAPVGSSSSSSGDGKAPEPLSPTPGPDMSGWDDDTFRLLVVPI